MSESLQNRLIEALKAVKIPAQKSDIVQNRQLARLDLRENSVVIQMNIPELTEMIEKSVRYQIEKAIQTVDSTLSVAIEFLTKGATQAAAGPVKPKIGTMIAVGSGKGGVGKSTMTVNLAIAFQKLGYKVGIFDCDVYGPSIPTMLKVEDKKPMMLNGKIQPVEAYGLKLMSAGFFVEPGQSIVWRGPMIHKLIQQFFYDVDWADTDILLVDLPPGTGDAPLSLSQTMPLTGAVMVSTPQLISLIDVHKGLAMFHQVKVPVLGIIENMSEFICSHCGHGEAIFDRGGVRQFCSEVQVPFLGEVPLEPALRKASDEGRPYLLDAPSSSKTLQALKEIAERLTPFLKEADTDESMRIVL